MSRFAVLLIGIVLGAGSMFMALRYHVVRADDGMHLIPRVSADFSEPYVDIRGFGIKEWNERRELALAIVRAGKGALIQNAAVDDLRKTMEDVMKSLSPGS